MIKARDAGPGTGMRYFLTITNDHDTYFYGFYEDGHGYKFLGTSSEGAHDSSHYGEVIDVETLPEKIQRRAYELENE